MSREELKNLITDVYESGVTVTDAERYAALFLKEQLEVSSELETVDLDARMKKAGVKAIKAAVYMESATKDPKKPSDVMLNAIVDMNEVVGQQQTLLDVAEANRDKLEREYNIFREAHIYFRGIAKGSFNA